MSFKSLEEYLALAELEQRKRKAEAIEDKDEMIALLQPPKSARNEYVEQKPAKYVFKCMDGDIQIPEYGILRTDFYYKGWVTQLRPVQFRYKTIIQY